MNNTKPVKIGLIGAGRIGSFHAETVAHRLTNATLHSIADPIADSAKNLAEKLGAEKFYTDHMDLLSDEDVDAVMIAVPARFHAEIAIAAARHGKAIFCEKPMALTLEETDNVIAAVKESDIVLQVGFNRRWDKSFTDGKEAIVQGEVGTPQILRSVIRDPGPWGGNPEKVPQWTIFYETLIHDFDTVLWLNSGAKPISVYAVADALIRPDVKESGFIDTAVVTIRFDNGAIAVTEASFSALYGYDIRGEVFGDKGMITMGDVTQSSMKLYNQTGVHKDTYRLDTERFIGGYTAQLRTFADSVRSGTASGPTAEDARGALTIALAAIRSVEEGRPVDVSEI